MKVGGWAAVAGGVLLTIFTAGLGVAAGVALIGAGCSLLAGGTVMLNLDIPNLNNREKPQQDPSIRGSQNQLRAFGYVPILFGQRRVYPDIASKPYTWIEADGKQYLYQLFCSGQKDQVIEKDSFRIGETDIINYSASKDIDYILSGRDALINIEVSSGTIIPLGFKCVHEEQLNVVLRNKTEEGFDAAVIRTTPAGTTEINIDVFFNNGLGIYNNDGKVVAASVEIAAYYKKEEDPDDNYSLLGYFNGLTNTIFGSELKTKRLAVTKTGLISNKWTVKIARISADTNDNKIIDTCYIGSIRSVKNTPVVSDYMCKKTTLIAVRVKATEKLSNVIEAFNFISKSKLPVCKKNGNGETVWNSYALSDNPASVALYALRGESAQQKIKETDIDWASFEKYYNWCKYHEYGCNEFVTEFMSITQLLQAVGSTSRAEITRINGRLSVIQDTVRDAAMQLFSPRNTKAYSETIMIADAPDAIALGFIDAGAGYAENEVTVYNTPTGAIQDVPLTTQDSKLWGVTSSEQARRIGLYKFAVIKNRPIIHKISVDFEYLMCTKGDLIKYAGDIALAGITQGRVVSLIKKENTTVGFISDEAVEMEKDKQYAIRLRKKSGEIILEKLQTRIGRSNEVFFETPGKECPEQGDLFAFGTQGNETIDLIITDIQCNDNLSAELTCVEYAPEIFSVDNPDFVLPPFDSKITDIAPALDSGLANPGDWRYFSTYNDSTSRPSAPKRAGTDDGWHYLQTGQSKWVSTKNEKAITDGVWSAPVETAKNVSNALVDGLYEDASRPDTLKDLTAKAVRDGILIKWQTLASGLKNTLTHVIVEIKTNSDMWKIFKSQATGEYFYDFTTNVGEYFEFSDFTAWRVRVKSVNIYNKESELYGGGIKGITIDTSAYGTWKVKAPNVLKRESNRSISFTMTQPARSDNREVYGNITYRISVKRLTPPADDQFYKPTTDKDPYADENNYKDLEDAYIDSGYFYSQTMPLKGQNNQSPSPSDTTYAFKIYAQNEAGVSDVVTVINAIAHATDIKDLVDASITNAKLASGCVSYDKIAANVVVSGQVVTNDLLATGARVGSLDANLLKLNATSWLVNKNTAIIQDDNTVYNAQAGEVCFGNTTKTENDDDESNYEYFHYRPGLGFFFKIKNFIIKGINTILKGIVQIFRTGESTTPVFEVNPGAAAGNESITTHGAFRVKKSTEDSETVFEATPSNIAFYENTVRKIIKTMNLPIAQTRYVKLFTIPWNCNITVFLESIGNTIQDNISISVKSGHAKTPNISIEYSKHNTAYGIRSILLSTSTDAYNSEITLWASFTSKANALINVYASESVPGQINEILETNVDSAPAFKERFSLSHTEGLITNANYTTKTLKAENIVATSITLANAQNNFRTSYRGSSYTENGTAIINIPSFIKIGDFYTDIISVNGWSYADSAYCIFLLFKSTNPAKIYKIAYYGTTDSTNNTSGATQIIKEKFISTAYDVVIRFDKTEILQGNLGRAATIILSLEVLM